MLYQGVTAMASRLEEQSDAAEPALVSNFGQDRRLSDWPTSDFALEQGFTMGNAATTLESIAVSVRETLNVSHIPAVRAALWSTAEGGGPGAKLVDLAVPDAMEQGDVAFAAPAGITLSANTTYHFVLYHDGRVDLRARGRHLLGGRRRGRAGRPEDRQRHLPHRGADTGARRLGDEVTVSGVMLMRLNGQGPGSL